MSQQNIPANDNNVTINDCIKLRTNQEVSKCQHSKIIKILQRSYCMKCGVLQGSVQVYKSNKFEFSVFFDPQKIIASQIKSRMPVPDILENKYYISMRNSVIDFLLEASSKLKFSFNTLHLSIMYMDNYLSGNSVQGEQLFVYAATALMLASKTIELDMKIPFISKLRKYTQLENPPTDFKHAELRLLKHFNWNLQCCTLIDHMESLLSMGVIFASDSISQDNLGDFGSPHSIKLESHYGSAMKRKSYIPLSQLSDAKIKDICHRIEKDYLRVANLVVREVQFLAYSESNKALASILYLRKLCGLFPICPQPLSELMTGNDDVLRLLDDIVLSLDPIFTENLLAMIMPLCSSAAVSPTNKHNNLNTIQEQRVSSEIFFHSKTDSKQPIRVPLGPHNNLNQEIRIPAFRTHIKQTNQNDDQNKQLSDCKLNLIQVFGPSCQPRFQNVRTPTNIPINNQYLLRFGSGQVKLNHRNHIK